jgi:tRNA-intron endonuclease
MQFNFYEILYLVKTNRVEVYDTEGKKLSEKEIIEEGKKYIELFEEKYLVYEDLRNKGYIIKPGMKYGVTFMVYEYGPGLDHAPFLVDVLRKDSSFSDLQIIRAGRLTHSVRKKLLVTSVDAKTKKINYYLFEWFE